MTLGRRGFTLVELLVVVAVLATIAGVVIVSTGDARERAATDLARSEMLALKKAILQFRADTGAMPAGGVADLLANPGIPAWDLDRRRGWRGPYITRETAAPVVLDPWGRPYRVLDLLDPGLARIESDGPNGVDDPDGGPGDDDLRLFVLR